MKILALGLALTLVYTSALHATVIGKSETGSPNISQINVITFADEGVLLIGDGGQVIAINTGDITPLEGNFSETKGFTAELAGRLGVKTADVEIIDLAVNPASGRLYVAARKQDDKSYVIVTLAPGGEIEHFALDNVEHAAIPLPEGVNRIKDIVWIDNRLLASAGAQEKFASKLFSVSAPLNHGAGGDVYSAETYHISHGKWETKAPMSVMLPYEENGKQYIVGAFSCTPVVKYPIEAIEPGAVIKGLSVIELGSGNRPVDMFSYEKDGQANVLTNALRFHHDKRPYGPSPHVAFRFDDTILGTDKVNEQGAHRMKDAEKLGDSVELAEPFFGVVQMDRLNDTTAIALRETNGNNLDLVTIALP
ncbi:MAG: hypothetical protein AAF591_03315 [Verrucomicrobiota bacterium]